MRLAAEVKMGFYPVNLATIDLICRSLSVKQPEDIRIIDPCCGAGAALEHIGKQLGVPKENLYGVELDEKRHEEASTRLGHVVHCSFFNAKIVPVRSFSMAWVNPPYDNELKQGGSHTKSMETTFIEHVARYVGQGGLIVLHCPSDRVTDEVKRAMCGCCVDVVQLQLPYELRPYRETVLAGTKKFQVENVIYPSIKQVTEVPTISLPKGDSVRSFDRLAPTDVEIVKHMEHARFWRMFSQSPVKVKLKPILPLGPGHLGLTLASGYLDGYFAPEGYEPHVVRGIAYKEEQLVKDETSESDDGKVTHTQTMRENIKLKIRAVNADGVIHEIK